MSTPQRLRVVYGDDALKVSDSAQDAFQTLLAQHPLLEGGDIISHALVALAEVSALGIESGYRLAVFPLDMDDHPIPTQRAEVTLSYNGGRY